MEEVGEEVLSVHGSEDDAYREMPRDSWNFPRTGYSVRKFEVKAREAW